MGELVQIGTYDPKFILVEVAKNRHKIYTGCPFDIDYNISWLAATFVGTNRASSRETCLRGFRQSEIQTSLPSCRDSLENRNFTRSKFIYETYQNANNKGADQSARMRRLVCVCVVRKPPKTGFLAFRPNTY